VPAAGGDIVAAFGQQAAWCESQAVSFMAAAMRASQAWLAGDDAARAAFTAIAADPLAGAVPLRWAGALHHLALQGIEPWASLWPPKGPAAPDTATLEAAMRLAWASQSAAVQRALAHPPQTNEVQRSAALLPGLLHLAGVTGLPLALIEIGASAGLNLWCDRWRYEHGLWSWGDAAAPLVLRAEWRGPAPRHRGPLKVARRAGNDALPIDLRQPGEGLRLASFIWPDQPERLQRLQAAQQAAAGWMAAEGAQVEAGRAADFVARQLAAPAPGLTRVLMHSVVWQYIDAAEQQQIARSVADAARQATAASPLAWLRFEPIDTPVDFELRCTVWPGGEEQRLARLHPHGAWVEWLAAA
jgi:hypothetical protein